MPRSGLSQSRVVEVAAGIADREGLHALTIARLAAVLKVRPPSLYNHLRNLDGLRDDLARRGLQELLDQTLHAVAGLAGPDALDAMGPTPRHAGQKHPPGYQKGPLAPSHPN